MNAEREEEVGARTNSEKKADVINVGKEVTSKKIVIEEEDQDPEAPAVGHTEADQDLLQDQAETLMIPEGDIEVAEINIPGEEEDLKVAVVEVEAAKDPEVQVEREARVGQEITKESNITPGQSPKLDLSLLQRMGQVIPRVAATVREAIQSATKMGQKLKMLCIKKMLSELLNE